MYSSRFDLFVVFLMFSSVRHVHALVVLFLPDCNSILSVSCQLRVPFGCLCLTMFIDRCCLRLLLLLLSCSLISHAVIVYVPCFIFVLLFIRVMFCLLIHALVRVWFAAHVRSLIVELSVCLYVFIVRIGLCFFRFVLLVVCDCSCSVARVLVHVPLPFSHAHCSVCFTSLLFSNKFFVFVSNMISSRAFVIIDVRVVFHLYVPRPGDCPFSFMVIVARSHLCRFVFFVLVTFLLVLCVCVHFSFLAPSRVRIISLLHPLMFRVCVLCLLCEYFLCSIPFLCVVLVFLSVFYFVCLVFLVMLKSSCSIFVHVVFPINSSYCF